MTVTVKASGCGVELSRNRSGNQEAFVSHANAALTPRARLRLARLIVDASMLVVIEPGVPDPLGCAPAISWVTLP